MKKYFLLFLAGLLFAICCFISFFIGQSYPKIVNTKIIRDTLVIRDTIEIKEPTEKIKWKEKEKLVYIPVVDTLIVYKNDTTYLSMPIEKIKYEDENYRAIVSGICPKLEEIDVYSKTIYVTEQKIETIKKHWNFDITAGPGVFYNGKINYGLGVVVGFGYSF